MIHMDKKTEQRFLTIFFLGALFCLGWFVEVACVNQPSTASTGSMSAPPAQAGQLNTAKTEGNFEISCTDKAEKECGSNIGECRTGIKTCNNSDWSECVGGVGPTPEVCDGKDNNCNGKTDELWRIGAQCGIGNCVGVYICDAEGTGEMCDAPTSNCFPALHDPNNSY